MSTVALAMPPSSIAKRTLRALAWTAGVLIFLVTLIGWLHTPMGRPILAKLGVVCPVTKSTPQAIDHARSIPAQSYAGKPSAPARPALGFSFEKSTMSDLNAWAKKYDVECSAINGNETLRACLNVPPVALGEPTSFANAEEVDFEFRASGSLAVITAVRRKLSVAEANMMTSVISHQLRSQLGEPSKTAGEDTVQHFGKGPMQAYQEEYEYGDLGISLTETRLGQSGVLLREHYFSPVP